MNRNIILVLLALSFNANAVNNKGTGDSTTLNIAAYTQYMQQTQSSGGMGSTERFTVNGPQPQVIYVTQPTQTTYVTQNGTVQCSQYSTVMSGYRYATTTEARAWGNATGAGCGIVVSPPAQPNGTLRVNPSQSVCLPSSWVTPVYQTVCSG